MAVNRSFQQVLDEAEKIVHTWQENPDFSLGEIQQKMLSDLVSELRFAEEAIDKERTKLTGMIEDRDKKTELLASYNTRARSGFRAIYGADSKQYKQAGGTPTSERKPPKRKPKATS